MSKQEFSRLDVLLRVQSGRLRVSDACVLIGLQRRQVFRLLRGLKQDGATSLLSKRRDTSSIPIRRALLHLTARMQLDPSTAFGFDAAPRSPRPPPTRVSSLLCDDQ